MDAMVRIMRSVEFLSWSQVSAKFSCHAAKYGWLRLMKWILKRGADVNLSPAHRLTPLHIAAYYGRRDAVTLLLDNGALVDAVDDEDETALHVAAWYGDHDLCKLLVSRGASLDMRNDDGEDPETRARDRGCTAVAALLAEIRAAGGWKAYVDAPRNEFLEIRRNLPALLERGRASVSHAPPHLARLFNPAHDVPEDVFINIFSFWRGPRDS